MTLSAAPHRVLVVEDEASVCEMMTELFAAEGYETACALGDQAAYEALEAGYASLSALVVDINLGRGTTGFDVARYARRLRPALPVIYITGASPKSFDAHGVDGGVMVSKPFDQDILLSTLREKLAGASAEA